MKVLIPTPLRSYTSQRAAVEAEGVTLDALLIDLDRRHPGIRFRMIDEQDRIRRHIRIFVNAKQVRELGHPLQATDRVQIIQALSGG